MLIAVRIMLKRLFDLIFAILCLFISLPLWFIIGILIKIHDGGPVFYTQERVGKSGSIFKIVKFRSMVDKAEKNTGPIHAKEIDSRTTPIGKLLRITALDELPQLLNIIKGEMSFVGPKPLRHAEIDIDRNIAVSLEDIPGFKERSSVIPGLTGIAQVLSSRYIPRAEKFKYDIWYIKNQNFFLDIYIIFLSFMTTFQGKWEKEGNKFFYLAKALKEKVENTL